MSHQDALLLPGDNISLSMSQQFQTNRNHISIRILFLILLIPTAIRVPYTTKDCLDHRHKATKLPNRFNFKDYKLKLFDKIVVPLPPNPNRT